MDLFLFQGILGLRPYFGVRGRPQLAKRDACAEWRDPSPPNMEPENSQTLHAICADQLGWCWGSIDRQSYGSPRHVVSGNSQVEGHFPLQTQWPSGFSLVDLTGLCTGQHTGPHMREAGVCPRPMRRFQNGAALALPLTCDSGSIVFCGGGWDMRLVHGDTCSAI